MSTLTPGDAFNEMATMLKTAWDANASAANGSDGTPDLLWTNTDEDVEPPVGKSWARVTIQHMSGEQCTLGPSSGTRRFERTGLITVQVFVPIGDGVTRGLGLAKVALDAFEGQSSPSGIWFRSCRINHIGRIRSTDMAGRERLRVPDPWEQIHMICDFTYYDSK